MERVQFGNLGSFFADDMILLASLEDDFQSSPGPFSAECKATGMNFQVSGSADITIYIR